MTGRFSDLPEGARLYIFAASRSLGEAEVGTLLSGVDQFLEEWHSHREEVRGARDWRHDRFLLIGIDEDVTALSGCSIDGLTRFLQAMETRLDVRFLDASAVLYRQAGEIRRVDRAAFRELVRRGDIRPDTIVFDNTIRTVGDLNRGAWEVPYVKAWHHRAFGEPVSTATGVE